MSMYTNLLSVRSGSKNELEKCIDLYGLPDPEPATVVDERDQDCPDKWVRRRVELLRLTGLHPFNCEPPLPILMNRGFLTPASLHYVRNHGPVPDLTWETHTVQLIGLDGNIVVEISMDDLVNKFTQRSLPVTLSCAGNRRKEQNVVKKSIGFSWGCGAVSTSIWTGVRLSDILEHYGLLKDPEVFEKTKWVNFEGCDELPKGRYGTSVALQTILDPARDAILAYMQNGKRLLPDHGYPVRVIIPGFIGGRMVKWLKKVQLSVDESESHYHFFDNRVLPPQITKEIANEGGWWFKPEYIINDRNLNSAISNPAHNEVLDLSKAGKTYTVQGYAYNGGGRKITRVEISLDYAKTWELTDVVTYEKPNKYGRYYCWVHWNIKIDPLRLLETKELCCRAWDESTNTQPINLTWNVMGMMNNPLFRVKIYPIRTKNGLALRFKHPATIQDRAGWMVDEKPKAPPAPVKASKPTKDLPKYTMSEVKKHKTKEDCWIVLAGKVYNVTKWLKDHPGGKASILMNGGKDSTKFFDAIHSQPARDMLGKWLIGIVANEPKL